MSDIIYFACSHACSAKQLKELRMFSVHAAKLLNRLLYSPDCNASRCMQTAITIVQMHAICQCNHPLVTTSTMVMLQEYELHGIFRGCCSVGFRWQDMENTHLREHLQVCHSHASNPSNAHSFGYIMPHLHCYTFQHAEAAQALARLHCTIRRRCTFLIA